MRVIAGHARGKKLAAPRGMHTRPTPGRVREALFSILGARVSGARLLDLYSGTGAIGLEALSRGAALAVFVDNDRRAQEALERNLQAVGGSGRLLAMPVARALDVLARAGDRFDIVFMDPPYAADVLDATLAAVAPRVGPNGLVIAEHHKKTPPPVAPAGLVRTDSRLWGDTALSFYAPLDAASSTDAMGNP